MQQYCTPAPANPDAPASTFPQSDTTACSALRYNPLNRINASNVKSLVPA
jgi:glucose dehydrogenase